VIPHDNFVEIGLKIHIRVWSIDGPKTPFLLVHGLASNSQTWDQVARLLAEAGHPVVAIDQRGHGMSDKPDEGYDFATITGDLVKLIKVFGWERPILVGQSWGGNVMLAFGALHPHLARGLIFVDGGYFDLQMRSADWETTRKNFTPPNLLGTPHEQMRLWMRESHPDWDDEGIEGQLGNFEILEDGTIRPWLTLERHLRILRALWEQRPSTLYPLVKEPVLIAVAGEVGEDQIRDKMIDRAAAGLEKVSVTWFAQTAHDIHVHRPQQLVAVFLEWLEHIGEQ
jgi:pimeloyl-ACP methyl ester carboxylesterase